MHHLVAPVMNRSISETVALLAAAHDYLVRSASSTIAGLERIPAHRWGIQAKRTTVALQPPRPALVEKASERFSELLNIAATLERLIDALRWFESDPRFSTLGVLECHPSTSHAVGSNDLVLANESGDVKVRCEVSDVVAKSAHQNSKERLDVSALGVRESVPDDGVARFLAVSSEFAGALGHPRRAWHRIPYRYARHLGDFDHATSLLEIVPASVPPA